MSLINKNLKQLSQFRERNNSFLTDNDLNGVEILTYIGVSFAEISALTGKSDSHLRRLGNKKLPGCNLLRLFELAYYTKSVINELEYNAELKRKVDTVRGIKAKRLELSLGDDIPC